MILSVNKIKALDVFLDRLIDKLQRLVNWLNTRQDDLIVNLSYGAVESAAKALSEAALNVLIAEDQYEAVVALVRDELGVDVDG